MLLKTITSTANEEQQSVNWLNPRESHSSAPLNCNITLPVVEGPCLTVNLKTSRLFIVDASGRVNVTSPPVVSTYTIPLSKPFKLLNAVEALMLRSLLTEVPGRPRGPLIPAGPWTPGGPVGPNDILYSRASLGR